MTTPHRSVAQQNAALVHKRAVMPFSQYTHAIPWMPFLNNTPCVSR